MKIKLLILIAVSQLLLIGCGNNANTGPKKIEGFHLYESAEFSIQAPNDWDVLTPVNFKSDMPKNAVLAFRNNLKNAKFTANVVIVKNSLTEKILSADYAKALHERVKNSLSSYKELAAEKRNLLIGAQDTESLFTDAKGRTSEDSDIRRYMQISAVKEKTAYVVTGAMSAAEDQAIVDKITTAIGSFEVK